LVTRRTFLAVAGGVIVAAIVAGTGYYYLTRPAPAPPPPTPPPAAPPKLTIPALVDKSGPTSDVGVDYAWGAENAAKWINEKEGGIPGIGKFDFVSTDYAYRIPEAIATYERYKATYNPPVIIGWGTGDTEALSPSIAKDQIVYISASYSSHLNDPAKTPYNFYPVCSYSDQMRAAIIWMKDYWTKELKKTVPPKICFAYDFGVPYCRAPIPAGKALAAELGFEIGPDQNCSQRGADFSSQVLAMKTFGANFVWMGNTTATAAVLAKDMKKHGLEALLMINQWGHDENLVKLAGEAAEGVHGMSGHYYWGFEAECPALVNPLRESVKLYGPKDYFPISSYIRGWINVRCAVLAIADAWAKFKEVSGPKVKEAMESWKDKVIEGTIVPPVTFTGADHRPNTKAIVLKIEGGKYKKASDWIEIERKAAWLGW